MRLTAPLWLWTSCWPRSAHVHAYGPPTLGIWFKLRPRHLHKCFKYKIFQHAVRKWLIRRSPPTCPEEGSARPRRGGGEGEAHLVVTAGGVEGVGAAGKQRLIVARHQHLDVVVAFVLSGGKHTFGTANERIKHTHTRCSLQLS